MELAAVAITLNGCKRGIGRSSRPRRLQERSSDQELATHAPGRYQPHTELQWPRRKSGPKLWHAWPISGWGCPDAHDPDPQQWVK